MEIWAIMAPGMVEAGSAKMDWIRGSRGKGASWSLELRKLLRHQGLLEQAGAHMGWGPGLPASSGTLEPGVQPGSAGPAGARISQGPALTGSCWDPWWQNFVNFISFFLFSTCDQFTVVDIST